ncbi:MAG: indolepyruvate oxidoreductase subunit beta [Pseudomonadota bacterium]
MSDKVHNVLLVGVGGQGVVLVGDILCDVAMRSGMEAKKSEIHGFAVRGGVVFSHVRFGEKVYSPLITMGEGDHIVAFEEMEALRWIDFLRPGGCLILNTQKIIHPLVSAGTFEYPKEISERLRGYQVDIFPVDALNQAIDLGNSRLVSTILIGALSSFLDFPLDLWKEAILDHVPKGTEESNIKAFEKGRGLGT